MTVSKNKIASAASVSSATSATSALDLSGLRNVRLSLEANPMSFFPKDRKPYPHQRDDLEDSRQFFAAPDERVKMDCISTAGGKTLLAMADAKAWVAAGGRAVILCTNKELQSQYLKAFSEDELSIVMGAGEFRCSRLGGESCGSRRARRECPARRQESPGVPEAGKGPETGPETGGGGQTASSCECPYRRQQTAARETARSRPMCFTPQSYMAFRKNASLAPALEDGDILMVVDEAHVLADQLSGHLSLSISMDLIESLLGLTGAPARESFREVFFSPGGDTQVRKNHEGRPLLQLGASQADVLSLLAEAATLWAGVCSVVVGGGSGGGDTAELRAAFPQLSLGGRDEVGQFFDFLRSLAGTLATVTATKDETRWACEITGSGSESGGDKALSWTGGGQGGHGELLLIRPETIPVSFLRTFFRGCSKVILMSGTLWKNHLERLGLVDPKLIDEDGRIQGVRRFVADSRIEAKRRKVVIDLVHGTPVNFRNTEEAFTKFARFILDGVTTKLPGVKGIIHVSSKEQADRFLRIAERLAAEGAAAGRGRGRLSRRPAAKFMSASELGWAKTFSEFKNAKEGGEYGENLFLIAARRYEGLDLADDLCRINIIAKVPYPNTKDSLVTSLDHVYKTYSTTSAMTSFIQAANRAVRHPGDWALNICLDTAAERLFAPYMDDMPEYVRDALVFERDPDWLPDWREPEGVVKKSNHNHKPSSARKPQ